MTASRRSRRPHRALLLLLVALGWVFLAAPAHADVPVGWSEPADVSVLHALVITVFAPIGTFLVLALLAAAPSLLKKDDAAEPAENA